MNKGIVVGLAGLGATVALATGCSGFFGNGVVDSARPVHLVSTTVDPVAASLIADQRIAAEDWAIVARDRAIDQSINATPAAEPPIKPRTTSTTTGLTPAEAVNCPADGYTYSQRIEPAPGGYTKSWQVFTCADAQFGYTYTMPNMNPVRYANG